MTETKTSTDHKVRLEFDGWGAPTSTFQCSAPAESNCHLEWGCDCEDIYYVSTTEDGNRYHEASFEVWDDDLFGGMGGWADKEERHYAAVNLNYCTYADWLDAVGNEALTGEITVVVSPEWDGDGFLFEIVGEVA